MAWTAPRTWVVGEVVTAALMNTHVRDNEDFLKGNSGEVVLGAYPDYPNTVQGDIFFHDGTSLARLPAGTSGYFLKTQGAAANPVWGVQSLPGVPGIFGDGRDGSATISGATTLSSDKFYTNLTVNTTIALEVAGYRLFVQGTLTNNGTILVAPGHGSAGQDGASGSAGGAPGLSASATVGTLGAGGTGGNGGTTGVVGTAAPSLIKSQGGAGGTGGAGGYGNIQRVGGAGASAPGIVAADGTLSESPFMQAFRTIDWTRVSGGGGGGGGGGGDDGLSGGGGGGGAGGAVLFLSVSDLVNNGTIKAPGGNGGAGGAAGAGGAGGGGGGAGGGGVIMLIRRTRTGSGTLLAPAGGTGAGGAGGSVAGSAGSAGAAGTTLEITIS